MTLLLSSKVIIAVSDLEDFDLIVESKEGSTNNKTLAKNAEEKNLNSNIQHYL